MLTSWEKAFSKVPGLEWKGTRQLRRPPSLTCLENLKSFLDFMHIKFCLLKPFFEQSDYPLVIPRELLPSFEGDLFEHTNLPGFSLVALSRPIDPFQEIFQFDILHPCEEGGTNQNGPSCPLEQQVIYSNNETFSSRLPRAFQDEFKSSFSSRDITDLQAYPQILPFLLEMDRGHALAQNSQGEYYTSGVFASFPSDLDTELKRFGIRIGKFRAGDNARYERYRLFVYQFLMELYGFPIASERRTSAALFARRLFRMGEEFLVQVLGQSDRTITTLCSHPKARHYPRVEKIALVRVDQSQKEQINRLRKRGFLLEGDQPAVIIRVIYRQHKYDPTNVREDRAMSVHRQEVIHPLTGQVSLAVNIIKDTSLMTLKLNDIVRGEFLGRIKYKNNEIVENTESHEKRLKFLYAWLTKHQRRIIGYSDEFYANVTKVLDSYLLRSENYDEFYHLNDLYQEVWAVYSYIQQARKVKQLEDLKNRDYKGQRIDYLEMLVNVTDIMKDFKFEIVSYYDTLVERAVGISETILNDSYLIRRYIRPAPDTLTDYGSRVRKFYGRLVNLVDDVKSIRRTKVEQEDLVFLDEGLV